MKTKFLLTTGASVLVAVILVIGFISGNRQHVAPPQAASVTSSPSQQENRESAPPLDPRTGDALKAALAETDSARRQELLKQWADTVDPAQMAELLSRMDSMVKGGQASEVRHVLLLSWIQRDKLGMATWFGNRNAVDALHAESRDLLVKALVGGKPGESLSWMETSLPESERQELYGPFFRQWTMSDPVAATARLRQLSEASPGKAAVWDNLIAQIAGQWATTDLSGALAWTKALPDGAAKSQALVQVSYQWARRDPQAAALYAVQQKDQALFDAVAGTWAGNDPRSAAAWAYGLPAGEGRNTAITTATTVWAQTDPKAAAAYVAGLSTEDAKNQGKLVIVSAWAYQDPAAAAKWVGQFPEGTIRGLALEQVASTWAQDNSDQASQWLQQLPKGLSRDVAVSAFCKVIDATDPDISFKWAGTISDTTMRNQKLESAAVAWLETNPAAARQSIVQSSLPENIKQQLMASVPQKGN